MRMCVSITIHINDLAPPFLNFYLRAFHFASCRFAISFKWISSSLSLACQSRSSHSLSLSLSLLLLEICRSHENEEHIRIISENRTIRDLRLTRDIHKQKAS